MKKSFDPAHSAQHRPQSPSIFVSLDGAADIQSTLLHLHRVSSDQDTKSLKRCRTV